MVWECDDLLHFCLSSIGFHMRHCRSSSLYNKCAYKKTTTTINEPLKVQFYNFKCFASPVQSLSPLHHSQHPVCLTLNQTCRDSHPKNMIIYSPSMQNLYHVHSVAFTHILSHTHKVHTWLSLLHHHHHHHSPSFIMEAGTSLKPKQSLAFLFVAGL